MTRYTGYVISYEGDEGKPLFGIIEDEGSATLALPMPSGKCTVEILNPGLDQETARQFRKKHGGSVGSWEFGNPDDLKREAYPVLVEQDAAAEAAKEPVVQDNNLNPKKDTLGDGPGAENMPEQPTRKVFNKAFAELSAEDKARVDAGTARINKDGVLEDVKVPEFT